MVRLRSRIAPAFLAAVSIMAACGQALAHASERGHVLLLPTGYYLAGGVAAVAASFLALAFVPAGFLDKAARRRLRFFSLPSNPRAIVSFISFLFFAALVLAGYAGSRDPLSNPLPLFVWTFLWVGLTLVSGIVGDVWSWLNPWYGPWRLAMRLSGGSRKKPLLRLPRAIGQWPAVATFFAFAWFELIDPAPDDPARLAAVVGFYWIFGFAGILVFGYGPWTKRVDFLSLFFTVVSHLSVFGTWVESGRRRLFLCLPGTKATAAPPRPPGGVAFLLLSLASVSFDGFMRTFTWLGWIGVNPLEFPGRSALIASGTAGLIGMFAALSAAFMLAVFLGQRIVGRHSGTGRAAALLIWSIVPISLAYHFAHYLTALLVDGQYLWVALSDPFDRGWNLFGAAHHHVHAGIVLGADAAWTLWNLQAFAIVFGHVLAVGLAHLIAFRIYGSSAKATLSQVPLAVLMVAYTLFGLWLLSTPSAG